MGEISGVMKARDNPFATGRLERLLHFDPALAGTSWEAIDARWQSLGRRACVLGRHGAGKTTFMQAFGRRLSAQESVLRLFFNDRHCRLDRADREILAAAGGSILLVDGEGHLPPGERRELRRAVAGARGCLWTVHRRGSLPVLLHLKSNLELAARLLERAAPEWAAQIEPELPRLMKRRRGNLRELWMDCYDRLSG